MTQGPDEDWDPTALGEPVDQLEYYDATRRRCPVAYSELFGWSLFRHEDVSRVVEDPVTFSNAVSKHLAVPNGMDPPRHGAFRRIIDGYFSAGRMARLEPECRRIAVSLLEKLPREGEVEVTAALAEPYAVQSQCAFLQWPAQFHAPLRDWMRSHHAAIRARDRAAMAAVAFNFDGSIRSILAAHRDGRTEVAGPLVGQLLGGRVEGRSLTDEEIVSILRNWTVGELGTISACIGILVRFVAERPDLQARLRANPLLLPVAIDEILRIHAPLMTSRRVTTAPVEIGGRTIGAGERITLMWGSANRDELAFERPLEMRLGRGGARNLLYGAGIHVCPGAPLARLELGVFMSALLAGFELAIAPGSSPVFAQYPAAGYSVCPISVRQLDSAQKESAHG